MESDESSEFTQLYRAFAEGRRVAEGIDTFHCCWARASLYPTLALLGEGHP
jgi:hypothetical protein